MSILGFRRLGLWNSAAVEDEIDEQALAKSLSQLLPENDPVPEKVDPEMLRIQMRRAGLRARRPGEADKPKPSSNYTGRGM
ncbi:MAG: hypothetical protein JKY56_16640 [Kofleriaceae bacterium]|nr:hypothetical protein [Kofleriaceae bacterium]